jgi:hypothetical protein
MGLLLPVLLVCFSFTSNASELDTCRELYFSENTKDNAQTFYDFCLALRADDPLTRAYKGGALARVAGYGYNPYAKYARFSEGKEKIESAIRQAPKIAEIRFIRLSIQINAPAFLNYDDNIDEDTQILVQALLNRSFASNKKLEKNITAFVLNHANCTSQERAALRALS